MLHHGLKTKRFSFNVFLKLSLILEEGKYLALDVGGTTLKVFLVELVDEKCNMLQKDYRLTSEIKLMDGEQVRTLLVSVTPP